MFIEGGQGTYCIASASMDGNLRPLRLQLFSASLRPEIDEYNSYCASLSRKSPISTQIVQGDIYVDARPRGLIEGGTMLQRLDKSGYLIQLFPILLLLFCLPPALSRFLHRT